MRFLLTRSFHPAWPPRLRLWLSWASLYQAQHS